jgi:hypothetical protein
MVISLTAKGLTTGEVSTHLGEVYGADVSRDTISRITDRVFAEMAEWENRPPDRVYPGDLHRRPNGQDPRRVGHQPARLFNHRRHRR